MENLGWANNWHVSRVWRYDEDGNEVTIREAEDNTPQVVKDCREAGHKLVVKDNHAARVSTVTCEVCGYLYKVDSSD